MSLWVWDGSQEYQPYANSSAVVAIPIWVLWTVQIKRRKKLSLGIYLCSNVTLAVITCFQVSGLRNGRTIDITWYSFWLQLQTSTAVSVFSFTAFRSLFTTEKSKLRARKKNLWHPSPIRMLRRMTNDTWYGGNQILSQSFPSATLTGMRTFIRGGRSVSIFDSETGVDHPGDVLLQDPGQITATHGLSSEVQEVQHQYQPSWVPTDTTNCMTID